jgi:hypothetical protein
MPEREYNSPFHANCADWELRNVHEWRWREDNNSIHAGDCPKFKDKGESIPDTVVRELWRVYQMAGVIAEMMDTHAPRDIGFFNCGNGQCTTVRN